MDKTLTIRLESDQWLALARAARRRDKTVSELVREILRQALKQRPLSARAGHLKGKLELPIAEDDVWRRGIKSRNWRP
jgi:macrodomain Ter protein organizer (MatP/YcbG family)